VLVGRMPRATWERTSQTQACLCGCFFLKQYTSLLLMRSCAIST
jgi:hypothetical protein